jgi:hypothetical protein
MIGCAWTLGRDAFVCLFVFFFSLLFLSSLFFMLILKKVAVKTYGLSDGNGTRFYGIIYSI